jgi:isopenicillin N synthase-like dioxygenase
MIEPGMGGLQVETSDGWVDAPSLPGAFVVNIGELLEFATDGYLKATVHRVVSPPVGQTRLSVAVLLQPSARLHRAPRRAAARARRSGERGEPDPANPISGTFGDNLLKARLRAHPDVAARHHADLLG